MTTEDKRAALYSYCEKTNCKLCKLNTGDWKTLFLDGKYKTMQCLWTMKAYEDELNRALILIGDKEMTKEARQAEMIRLREEGYTMREIGEMFGVSKQCVCQSLPRVRKGEKLIRHIKLKGIREWLLKHPEVSFANFIGYAKHGEFRRVYKGTLENYRVMFTGDREVRLSLTEIRNILELTGLNYDKAFKEEV